MRNRILRWTCTAAVAQIAAGMGYCADLGPLTEFREAKRGSTDRFARHSENALDSRRGIWGAAGAWQRQVRSLALAE